MDTKLATIQKIASLSPIEGADMIEVASLEKMAWKVVVKKGEFHVGNLCCYCSIDTILPDKPQFEFLRSKSFRIKTIRLKKQLSQGIIFPLSILPDGDYIEGQDCSEIIGIIHYEKPVPISLAGQVKGNFPTCVSKTDEERVQNCPNILQEISGKEVYITTKIDGTSASFINIEGDIHVCSRNLSLKETEGNIYWKIFRKYNLEEVLKRSGSIAVQGEIAGVGIQKNPLALTDHELFVFNVYDITKGKYYNYAELIAFCQINGLQTVPVESVEVFKCNSIDDLLQRAEGTYKSGKLKEGIVIRSTTETYSDVLGGRMSFKVLNNMALLKEE